MANAKATHVVTGVARLSYAHLTQPYGQNGQEPKYSVTVLVPKADTATMQRINAAMEAAIQDGAARLWGGRPAMIPTPVYDGDGTRPSDGKPFGPECKGHYVFTTSSKNQPEIVDAFGNPIINQTEIYSGMYAHVSVDFYPYANSGRKGVGCGLGNVMKVQDGEPLGGRTSAADDFAGMIAAGQPASAPSTYTQPMPQAYQPAQLWPDATAQPAINPMTGLPITG